MQAETGAAVFAGNVYPLHSFVLQQLRQPSHAGVTLVGNIRQGQDKSNLSFSVMMLLFPSSAGKP